MPRLRRTSPSSPGWSRRRHGRGFRYLDEDGRALSPIEVERCRALVIPPAWTQVWICPVENGHLQAVGTDDAGRRQYLYHPRWRERRDLEKFAHMEDFAKALLARRATSRHRLGGEGLSQERVTAAAFSLLDLGMFRIGSDRYAEENGSHGLTTIERHHVRVSGDEVAFAYPAKSGQEVAVSIRDRRVAAVLRALHRRRSGGERLFAYRSGRQWRDLTADDVNDYVKDLLGEDCTAKDFRTWRANTVAALSLARGDRSTATRRKRTVSTAMREVSEHLGNTPAIARASYVDPRLVDLFEDGVTVSDTHRRVAPGRAVSRALERQVLNILRGT